ncbi:hypothetical protein CANINC_001310 [Pichia inconspicua]|uniref:Phosphatidic acid phosphatase type 2/haloperoxidase domain-containing protein n=1 Tax=Pichia inconspicua TaxID=52247 RepID=A0A4T0X421_9ASCO|nr:hypothetical protein CANINC_001310 [[Candida] inconspicua]
MISPVAIVKKVWASFCTATDKKVMLTQMETSFDPFPRLKKFPSTLQNTPKSITFKYSLIILVMLFSIVIMPFSIMTKLILISVLIYINFAPILAQFFNNGLPILGWVFLFFTSKFIPLELKRPISVKVLPALETMFYGDNLSEILASRTNTFLDIFSWLPYGIIHFSLPFIVAFLIFVFAPPQTLPQFCWSFGFMNLTGVIIQNLIFSCAPPWYKVLHGLDKANYNMEGSPGGLGRIDKLLGVDMYTSGFTHSPLIFGAMPSLHSGCSTMDALWLSYLFPKASPIFALYVTWLWFSTMYLTHHYFIDVVVGSCLAVGFFLCVKWKGMLAINDKFCRWDYESIQYHNIWAEDPLKQSEYDDFTFVPDIEDQIPLSDLTSSSNENSQHEPSTKLNEEQALNDDEDFESDNDEILEANDVEKSANKTVKKFPKTYKESFEATIPNTSAPSSSNSRN